MLLIAAYSVWWITFITGFFILGPSIDDGYYIEFSINSMNGHGPGFWLGETFSPVFFVFPSFAWFYGKALWLVFVINGEFGPMAFRAPHLLILLCFPFFLHRWLRFLKVSRPDYVLLMLTAFLATSYFFQQAITVRPELLAILLLLVGWPLLPKIEQGGSYSCCFLFGLLTGCGIILHPVFTVLNGALLGSLMVKQLRTNELCTKDKIFNLGLVFCGVLIPVFLFLFHIYRNRSAVAEQLFKRVSEVSPRSFEVIPKLWDDLFQFDASESVFYYIYAAYPTIILLVLAATTGFIIIRNRWKIWQSRSHWPFLPLGVSAIFLFFLLQPYPPYLLVCNFFFAAIVAVWAIDARFLTKKWVGNIFWPLCCIFSFAYIFIHLAKPHVGSASKYLNPVALYDSVMPELAGTDALLITTTARIMPPLLGFYQNKEGGSRIKTFTFSPQKSSKSNQEIGNAFLENVSKMNPPPPILFAAAKKHRVFQSSQKLWVHVQGLGLEARLVHGGIIYQDKTNIIVRVKSMCVAQTGEKTCR